MNMKQKWTPVTTEQLLERKIQELIKEYKLYKNNEEYLEQLNFHVYDLVPYWTVNYMKEFEMELYYLQKVLIKHPEWLEYFI